MTKHTADQRAASENVHGPVMRSPASNSLRLARSERVRLARNAVPVSVEALAISRIAGVKRCNTNAVRLLARPDVGRLDDRLVGGPKVRIPTPPVEDHPRRHDNHHDETRERPVHPAHESG